MGKLRDWVAVVVIIALASWAGHHLAHVDDDLNEVGGPR